MLRIPRSIQSVLSCPKTHSKSRSPLSTRRFYNPCKDPKSTNVVIALSGGVDSAVSAYLLKQKGFNVSGIYMRNWSEADEAYCSGQDDLEQVDRVCHYLNIPYKVVDFQKEYWNYVFEPLLRGYQSGVTPNPDIMCNKEIKFKSLTDFVFSRNPPPHYLATGHYAQLRADPINPNQVQLQTAVDANKDQTYFLLQVQQQILSKIIFPIGHLTKPQVRAIATEAKLPNAARKESMGLCFIGKRKFDDFLGEFTTKPGSVPGPFKLVETGEVVGQHKGALFYTIGQSASISGASARMFVAEKSIDSNEVMVCTGSHHAALYRIELTATSLNWIGPRSELLTGPFTCQARIRHRQQLHNCVVTQINSNGDVKVRFERPLRAVALGQHVGFYKDDICLGGGIINEVGPSYWELGKKVEILEAREETS